MFFLAQQEDGATVMAISGLDLPLFQPQTCFVLWNFNSFSYAQILDPDSVAALPMSTFHILA